MKVPISCPIDGCSNCGQQIGLHAEHHTCRQQQRISANALLPVPKGDMKKPLQVTRKPVPSMSNSNPGARRLSLLNSHPSELSDSQTTRPEMLRTKSVRSDHSWTTSQEDEKSIYFTNYAVHLHPTLDASPAPKKKLWKRVRNNEKFKEFSSKVDMAKPNAKLWGKFIKSMADKMPMRDDRGPASDESDWEGESHVSRVLREYYEKKQRTLPYWMHDTKIPEPKKGRSMVAINGREAPRKHRLWEKEPAEPPHQQQQQPRPPTDATAVAHVRQQNSKHITDNGQRPLSEDRSRLAAHSSFYNMSPPILHESQLQPHAQHQQHLLLRNRPRSSTTAHELNVDQSMCRQPSLHLMVSGSQCAETRNSGTDAFRNVNKMISRARVRGPRDAPAFQTRSTARAAESRM